MELFEWRGVLPSQRGLRRLFAGYRLIRRDRLYFRRKFQTYEQNKLKLQMRVNVE